jgi:hypothetical protein
MGGVCDAIDRARSGAMGYGNANRPKTTVGTRTGVVVAINQPETGSSTNSGRALYALPWPRAIRTVPLAQVLARDQRGGGTIAALSEPVSRSLYSCGLRQLEPQSWIMNKLHHDGAQSQPRKHQRSSDPVRKSERKRPNGRGGNRALSHR